MSTSSDRSGVAKRVLISSRSRTAAGKSSFFWGNSLGASAGVRSGAYQARCPDVCSQSGVIPAAS